jgi:hypothetical protein
MILESTFYFSFSLSICYCKRYFSSRYYSLIFMYLSSVTLWICWIGARACNNGDGLKCNYIFIISSDFLLGLRFFYFCLFLKKLSIYELTYLEISFCNTKSMRLMSFIDKALTKDFLLCMLSPFFWDLKRRSCNFFLVKRSYAWSSRSEN